MELDTALWLAIASLASLLLIQLMHKRQKQLIELLRDYSQTQLEQAHKRARVAQLARNTVSDKADQEAAQARLFTAPEDAPDS